MALYMSALLLVVPLDGPHGCAPCPLFPSGHLEWTQAARSHGWEFITAFGAWMLTLQGNPATYYIVAFEPVFPPTVLLSKIHFGDIYVLLFKYLYPVVSLLLHS